jgi:hypothetical protein
LSHPLRAFLSVKTVRLVAFQPATRSRVLHRGALYDICHSQPSARLQRPDVDLLGPRFEPCQYRGICVGNELRDVAASPELWLHSATLACEPGCDRPRGVFSLAWAYLTQHLPLPPFLTAPGVYFSQTVMALSHAIATHWILTYRAFSAKGSLGVVSHPVPS